jgi:Toastrack DUF4097
MRIKIRTTVAALGAIVLASSLAVAQDHRDRKDYPVVKSEEIRKTLKFTDQAKPRELVVDNVFGPVTVEGYAGSEVLLTATRTVYAKSEDKAALAAEEVKLDIQEKGGTVDIYVDGPFRENEKTHRRARASWRDPGYEVHYAFTLKVPVRTNVAVSTVTEGDVEVRGVEGEFDVHNVNGKVRLTDVAGRGTAETVNGGLTVGFRSAPGGGCSFKTVNGDLVLTLPANPSADFKLKTFNGQVWSDFDMTRLPIAAPARKSEDGKFVYRSDRSFGVRAGKGGPEIALDTMNGDILIKKRTA